MKHVLFEFMMDMKRKMSEIFKIMKSYELMIEWFWLMMFVVVSHFEGTLLFINIDWILLFSFHLIDSTGWFEELMKEMGKDMKSELSVSHSIHINPLFYHPSFPILLKSQIPNSINSFSITITIILNFPPLFFFIFNEGVCINHSSFHNINHTREHSIMMCFHSNLDVYGTVPSFMIITLSLSMIVLSVCLCEQQW